MVVGVYKKVPVWNCEILCKLWKQPLVLSVWLTHIVLQIVLNMLLNTEDSTHFIK